MNESKPKTYPLILRNPDVLRIWLGQVLSQMGTRMYQIAVAWWLVTRGGESAGKDVGLFMVAGALPSLLFVKPIGAMAQGISPKKILIASDLVAFLVALAAAALVAIDYFGFWGALIAGFFLALCQACFDPALNIAVAEAAAPEDMEEAVAFQSSTQSLASFAGAMAGALLIERIGVAGVALVNAASFLVSAGLTSRLISKGARAAPAEKTSGRSSEENLPASQERFIKRLLLGFGMTNFFATPVLVVLPLYVRDTLQGSSSLLGFLEAGLWLGLVAGTFLSKKLETQNIVRLGSFCLFTLGVCLFFPGLVPNAGFYFVSLAAGGFALGINNVKFVTLFQELVPPANKGRFFASLQATISFTFPVAYFLFGLLLDSMIPPWVCLIQGAGVITVAAYFFRLSLEQTREAYG